MSRTGLHFSAPWLDVPPIHAGRYHVLCEEAGSEPQPVCVFEQDGALWVDCPDVGTRPLQVYHDNLASVEWRRAEVQ